MSIVHTETKAHRLSSEERKQQIVAAAIRGFAEHGFRGTTTKQIAEAAGISEALLYRHFETKEELYDAIIDHKMQESPTEIRAELIAAAERGDDGALLRGVGSDVLRLYEEDPGYVRLLVNSALEGHDLSQRFFERQVRPYYEFLSEYISKRKAQGVFRDVQPLAAARAWMGMLNHHALVRMLFGDRIVSLSNQRILDEFTDIFLRGILKA